MATDKQVEAALTAFAHNRDVVKNHGFASMAAAIDAAEAAREPGPVVTPRFEVTDKEWQRFRWTASEHVTGELQLPALNAILAKRPQPAQPAVSDELVNHVHGALAGITVAVGDKGAARVREALEYAASKLPAQPAEGVVWTLELAEKLVREQQSRPAYRRGKPLVADWAEDMYRAGLAVGLVEPDGQKSGVEWTQDKESQLRTALASAEEEWGARKAAEAERDELRAELAQAREALDRWRGDALAHVNRPLFSQMVERAEAAEARVKALELDRAHALDDTRDARQTTTVECWPVPVPEEQ